MISQRCPNCFEILQVPDSYAGVSGTCTKCGGRITISKDVEVGWDSARGAIEQATLEPGPNPRVGLSWSTGASAAILLVGLGVLYTGRTAGTLVVHAGLAWLLCVPRFNAGLIYNDATRGAWGIMAVLTAPSCLILAALMLATPEQFSPKILTLSPLGLSPWVLTIGTVLVIAGAMLLLLLMASFAPVEGSSSAAASNNLMDLRQSEGQFFVRALQFAFVDWISAVLNFFGSILEGAWRSRGL